MNPQIELLFVLSDDGQSYYPLVAALTGFPWTSDERSQGIVGDCPDVVAGADVDALLAMLTADGAPQQIQYPFQVTHTITVRGRSRTVMDKPSSWGILASSLSDTFTSDDANKPVLAASTVSDDYIAL